MRRHLAVWATACPPTVLVTIGVVAILTGAILLAAAAAAAAGIPAANTVLVVLVPLPLAVPALAGWWR